MPHCTVGRPAISSPKSDPARQVQTLAENAGNRAARMVVEPVMRIHLPTLVRLVFLALVGAWLSPAAVAAEREILVSAAISLKEVLSQAGAAFERAHPEVHVAFNFAASGQLKAQIENGAPVDVFVSASGDEMTALGQKGLLLEGTRADVARNALVLVRGHSRAGGPATLADLGGEGVRRLAIGNPASVPAGRYARDVLEHAGLTAAVAGKLILAENVRQVLDYVARGEVDAGFVYRTDARTEARVRVVVEVAPGLHAPILYPAAVLAASRNAEAARAFVGFLRTPEARALFEARGFEAPAGRP